MAKAFLKKILSQLCTVFARKQILFSQKSFRIMLLLSLFSAMLFYTKESIAQDAEPPASPVPTEERQDNNESIRLGGINVADGKISVSKEKTEKMSEEELEKIIKELGHSNFFVREEAVQKLMRVGYQAYGPLLKELKKNRDYESVSRINTVLRNLQVAWVQPGDNLETTILLRGYGDLETMSRRLRILALCGLPAGGGMPGLCRAMRFDRNSENASAAMLRLLEVVMLSENDQIALRDNMRRDLESLSNGDTALLMEFVRLIEGEGNAKTLAHLSNTYQSPFLQIRLKQRLLFLRYMREKKPVDAALFGDFFKILRIPTERDFIYSLYSLVDMSEYEAAVASLKINGDVPTLPYASETTPVPPILRNIDALVLTSIALNKSAKGLPLTAFKADPERDEQVFQRALDLIRGDSRAVFADNVANSTAIAPLASGLPRSSVGYLQLARLLMKKKLYDRAKELLLAVLERQNKNVREIATQESHGGYSLESQVRHTGAKIEQHFTAQPLGASVGPCRFRTANEPVDKASVAEFFATHGDYEAAMKTLKNSAVVAKPETAGISAIPSDVTNVFLGRYAYFNLLKAEQAKDNALFQKLIQEAVVQNETEDVDILLLAVDNADASTASAARNRLDEHAQHCLEKIVAGKASLHHFRDFVSIEAATIKEAKTFESRGKLKKAIVFARLAQAHYYVKYGQRSPQLAATLHKLETLLSKQ